MEYFRSISSAVESVRAVPSLTEPCRLLVPATNARASTREVLPLAPWPTTATLRISGVLYTRIAHAAPAGGEENMEHETGGRLGVGLDAQTHSEKQEAVFRTPCPLKLFPAVGLSV